MLLNSSSSDKRQLPAFRWIVQQCLEFPREIVRVSFREDDSGVSDDFRKRASIRCQHHSTARHRFNHDQPECFCPERRDHHDVRLPVKRTHVGDVPQELHASEVFRGCYQ